MADELEPVRRGGAPAPRRFTPRQIVGGVLVAIVVVLVLQNTNNADVHLLLFTASYPMWLVLGGIMIVSFLAGWLFGRARGARRQDR
jgi:uncharacterized integral membrane protein